MQNFFFLSEIKVRVPLLSSLCVKYYANALHALCYYSQQPYAVTISNPILQRQKARLRVHKQPAQGHTAIKGMSSQHLNLGLSDTKATMLYCVPKGIHKYLVVKMRWKSPMQIRILKERKGLKQTDVNCLY